MDRNDPTATVQAVADLLGHLDGAFWAAIRCTDYPARTLVPVWQAIEDDPGRLGAMIEADDLEVDPLAQNLCDELLISSISELNDIYYGAC